MDSLFTSVLEISWQAGLIALAVMVFFLEGNYLKTKAAAGTANAEENDGKQEQ